MLSAGSRFIAVLQKAHRSDRGQMIVVFVAIFTVILAFMAFAIDQGFWLGRRRVAQTSADLAARGGAIAFFGNVLEPCEEAAATAAQNGVNVPNPPWCNDDPEPTDTEFEEVTVSGIEECVRAQLDSEVPGLFSRVFGINEINVGADATACAGTVRDISVNADNDGPEGIPIVLADGGPRDCFNGNNLAPGVECVVWASMDSNQHNRLLWDDERDCDGSVSGTTGEIQNGVGWKCYSGTYGPCPGPTCDVGTDYIDGVGDPGFDQVEMRAAIQGRLAQSTNCDSLESGAGPAVSFRNAFGRGDGAAAGAIPPPPFPGGANPLNAIYVQNDCFNNPRIVVLPFTNESATSGGNKDIDGFAVIYVTGCYRSNQAMHTSPAAETETDRCLNWPPATNVPGNNDDVGRDCVAGGPYTPSDFCRYEIRGVPIRLFITEGAIGRLSDMTDTDGNNFPLSIQTVE